MTDDARGEDLESESPDVVRAALRKRMDALRVGEEPDPIDLAEAVALSRRRPPWSEIFVVVLPLSVGAGVVGASLVPNRSCRDRGGWVPME